MYQKICNKCGERFEAGSRNKQKCELCLVYKSKGSRKSQYTINVAKLDDTEIFSYFMGFCTADGSVSLLSNGKARTVRYLSTDREIIEKIDARLEYTREISINREFDDHRKTCWENILYANNARYFVERGLTKDKREHTLDSMDVCLYPFLRGALDGDGCIGERYVQFLGQKLLLESIRERLGIGGNLYKASHKEVWSLTYWGRAKGLVLLSKIYDASTIHLDRKYNKAMQFMSRTPRNQISVTRLRNLIDHYQTHIAV